MAKRLGDSTQRGVELIFQFNNRQINRPVLAGLPDDVQSDPGKRRVSVVSMLSPAFGDEIDAQIALNRRGAADLDESPAKIRPGLVVYESGMQHCNTAADCGAQSATADALVLPNLLQELLRRPGVPLAQDGW